MSAVREAGAARTHSPTDNNTRRFPRSLSEAYPCERAAAVEGPYRNGANSAWWWLGAAALVIWVVWLTLRLMGKA